MNQRRATASALAIILLLVSLFCWSLVIIQVVHGKHLRESGLRVDGTVTDIRNGGAVPTIHFVMPDGRSFDFSEYMLNNGLQIGQHVPVMYQDHDPADTARVDTGSAGGVNLFLVFIGMASFVLTMMAVAQSVTDAKIW